jgi:hypothetical protein
MKAITVVVALVFSPTLLPGQTPGRAVESDARPETIRSALRRLPRS